jgi:hypothetical protein
VVRDGLLVVACTMGDHIDPFVYTLYETFGFDKKLLRNLASAGEAARATGKPAFFDAVWVRMINDVVEMDNKRRLRFVEAVEDIALLKPADIVRILRTLHRNPPENDEQEFGEIYRVSATHVNEAIPKAIVPIPERYPEYARPCVDLLWELAEGDARELHSHPNAAMRVLRDAAGYDGATVAAREAIVDAVERLLRRSKLEEHLHSPIEILEPILAREADTARSRGAQLHFTQFAVPLARFTAVRDRSIAIMTEAIFGGSDARAVRAIRIITHLLSGISAFGSQGEDAARLRHEQTQVLDISERLAAEGNVVRRLVLRDEMLKCDRWTGQIGERIQRIIEAIPIDVEAMLYRPASPELTRHWHGVGIESLHAHEQALSQEGQMVARSLLDQFPENCALVDRLEAVCDALGTSGLTSSLAH